MISSLVVSKNSSGRLNREEAMLEAHAKKIGLPVTYASEKMMERGKVSLPEGVLVGGAVTFVLHAMRRLGITVPVHEPYPVEMTPWLHRWVRRREKLRDVLDELRNGRSRVFVKPAAGWKKFTGFVVEFPDDYRFYGVSRNVPVWISEPLEFVSEWRAYVANGEVLDVRFADHGGNRAIVPDYQEIDAAVRAFEDGDRAPRGYVIDFGVTADGRTALIEVNDGFSFGAYDGVSDDVYWKVTSARWVELLGRA